MTIFISHSDKDRAIYQTLCMALDAKKVSRWDVAAMLPGESLSDQLRQSINECHLCVFVATRRSLESQWCLAELGAFWGSGKTVILFMVDPELDESVLPPQFRGNLRASSPQQLIDVIQAAEARATPPAGITGVCRKIASRRQLYIECLQLIKTSEVIRDTTWGRKARDLTQKERKARELYRAAIGEHIASDKDYHELLTAEGRDEYLAEARGIKESFPNYQCKVLAVDLSKLSMLDIMIGDNDRVIFSHVSATDPNQIVQYVYAESETLARLFLQFYCDAWRNAIDIAWFNPVTNGKFLKENSKPSRQSRR